MTHRWTQWRKRAAARDDGAVSAAASDPVGPSWLPRWLTPDTILYGILFFFIAGLLIVLFDFYEMPHNDFIQFADAAKRYINLQPPDSYKILPVFPLAIALVSRLIPSDFSLVHATQVVVLVSALLFLLAFMRIAARYLPWGGPLLLFWVAVSPYFLEFSLQTLLEMTLLAVVTLCLWRYCLHRDDSFVFASLASLTRYDAVFMVPLVGLARYLDTRRSRYFYYTFFAMLGFLLWMVASTLQSQNINPYIDQMLEIEAKPAFIKLTRIMVRMLLGMRPLSDTLSWTQITLAALVGLVIVRGAWRLWRIDRGMGLICTGYMATYFAMHAVFKAANHRYNYPIYPFLLLLFFLAAEPAGEPVERPNKPWLMAAILPVLGAALFAVTSGGLQFTHVKWIWGFSICFSGLFFLLKQPRLPGKWIGSILAWLMVLLCLYPQLSVWEYSYNRQKWAFSEYPAVARWTEKHYQPGDKIVMVAPWMLDVRYPPDFMKRFVQPDSFKSTEAEGFVEDCRRRGVTYVVWVNSTRTFRRQNWYHLFTKGYILNELGLAQPATIPCFEIVEVLRVSPGHYAHIFRFHPEQTLRTQRNSIDPNEEWRARELLLDGWCDNAEGKPGKRYIWALGSTASFRMFVENPEDGGTLSFVAYPYKQPDLPAQTIQVKVNDQPLGNVVMEEKERKYTVKIASGQLLKGENRFTFTFGHSSCPFDLGINNDRRSLSALFKRISFIANQPAGKKVQTGITQPLLPDDTCLDPNREEVSRRLLLEGWSEKFEGPAGKKYLWAVGSQSSLLLFIQVPETGGELAFTAFPYVAKNKPNQTVDLSVNDTPAGRVTLVNSEKEYRLKVPSGSLHAGENLFRLTYGYHVSPFQLGISGEKRPLAVMFKKICFLPGVSVRADRIQAPAASANERKTAAGSPEAR